VFSNGRKRSGRWRISAATVEEVYFGLSWKSNPRIQTWFEGFLATHCEGLAGDGDIAKRYGEIRGQLRARVRLDRQQTCSLLRRLRSTS
jgi:hypothetical protein